MRRVFLDATCWIAAAGSAAGGSSAIILLAQELLLVLLTSQAVLTEAERNIRAKMPPAALQRFYALLDTTQIEVSEPTTREEEERWAEVTVEKDRHVLAAALKTKADVLVSLDQRHLLNATVQAAFPLPVQDTKEFLTSFRD